MSKHKHRGRRPDSSGGKQWARWVALALFAAAVVGAIVMFQPPPAGSLPSANPGSAALIPGTNTNTSTNSPANPMEGSGRLVGRWLRLDGDYVLEIRSASADGKLDARYLNPRSINVARAEWQRKGEALEVLVEMRDVNYPGSTYTLKYSPGADKLAGNYYQAAESRNFEVEFERQN